jgi:hypothetical protein
MPVTILGENALQLPAGTRAQRPAGTGGQIRYNTDSQVFEQYHTPYTGTANWYGLGGKQLIARATRNDAWNTMDLTWGHTQGRYMGYEIYVQMTDPATDRSRLYAQVFDVDGNLYNPAAPNAGGYTYVDNWSCANDGVDQAGQNYNIVNTNGQSYFPVSNWSTQDASTGYWSGANGESHQCIFIRIFNSIPSGFTTNHISYDGTYLHMAPLGSTHAKFGGVIFNLTATTATNGQTYYPVTGIRIGYLDGYTNPAVTGVSALVTVYGLTGTEERDL